MPASDMPLTSGTNPQRTEQTAKTTLSIGNWDRGKTRLIAGIITSVALSALAITGSLIALGMMSFSPYTLGALTIVALSGTAIVGGLRNVWVQTFHTMEMTLSVFAHPNLTKTGCWVGNWLAKMAHFNDEALSQGMIKFFKEEKAKNKDQDSFRIVDLGCGNGYYVKELLKQGFEARGYDGNPNTCEMTGDQKHFKVKDLAVPITDPTEINGPFDWVVSLEVGEHIPKEHMETYIQNLTNSCTDGIILSWALPNQGGYSHTNELPNDVIIDKFAKLDLTYDKGASEKLRSSADLPWFPNTVMVFRKS